MLMANKDLLKNLEDPSEINRENSLLIIIELLQRCTRITPFLPYIFAALIDRTNCNDLEGIANLPEKMRPAPGQKPKVIVKLVEKCEEIRMLYCTLMKKILSLVEEAEIRDKLDEIVNILRALIMDPSSDIQVMPHLFRKQPARLWSTSASTSNSSCCITPKSWAEQSSCPWSPKSQK